MRSVRLIKHEAIPQCGSFEVRFSDGRPSQYFYWETCPAAGSGRTWSPAMWPWSRRRRLLELSAIDDGAHHNGYRLAGDSARGSRYADISPVRIYHCAIRFALAHCPLNQPHLAPAPRTFEGVYLVAFRNRLRADNPPLHGANDTGLRAPHRTISLDVRQVPRAKHQRDRLDSQYGVGSPLIRPES